MSHKNCYLKRDEIQKKLSAAEAKLAEAENNQKDWFQSFANEIQGHINTKNDLQAALAASREQNGRMAEAIGVFFHHWEHGGIRQDNRFHAETARALKAALSPESEKLARVTELERKIGDSIGTLLQEWVRARECSTNAGYLEAMGAVNLSPIWALADALAQARAELDQEGK